jgi:hypothetical protein
MSPVCAFLTDKIYAGLASRLSRYGEFPLRRRPFESIYYSIARAVVTYTSVSRPDITGKPMGRRTSNKRSDDLAAALRNGGHKSNGNHRIEIVNGLLPPSVELCKDCNLNLRCLASDQISPDRAFKEERSCCRDRNLINFYYHSSCCLTFDRARRKVTDHKMYGYSVTTSGNIRKYLHALWDNFSYLDLSYSRIDEIIQAFKAHNEEAELWLDV